MRTLLSLLSLLFVFGSIGSQAFADEKDTIDTGKGLTYTKPEGWVKIDKAKKGAVSGLHAAGDKNSQIEFRFASLTAEKASQYFTTFHGSLNKAGLKVATPGASQKFGKLNGKLTEYQAGKGEKAKRLFVFEFTTSKGAWLVVGMFAEAKRDGYLKDFESLLGGVVPE